MARFLLHLDIGEDFHAGSKAMKDCETVLTKKNYRLLRIHRCEKAKGILGKIQNELQFFKFFSLKKEDTLSSSASTVYWNAIYEMDAQRKKMERL